MATADHYIPGRPLVVIVGWLGCHRRSLRRYEALYREIGFGGVLLPIPSPRMVVLSSTQTTNSSTVSECCPNGWPHYEQQQHSICSSMQQLVWDTLGQVYVSDCSAVVFHLFSNGGGFFWEQVRDVLNNKDLTNNNRLVAPILDGIRTKVLGVVFDSCPAFYSPMERNSLLDALRHCTWPERMGAYVLLAKQVSTVSLREREERAATYFNDMRNDAWNVRQLYLCSKDDGLSPYVSIEGMVRHRQRLFGPERIHFCEWESSPHCCHMLYHPTEYRAAVREFVERALHGESPMQSKL